MVNLYIYGDFLMNFRGLLVIFILFVSDVPAEMAAVRRSPGGATLKRIANILDLFFPWETMKILRKSGQILLQTAIAFRKLFLLLSNDVCTLFIS